MPSENYSYLLRKFGALRQCEPLTDAARAAVRRRLPPELADFLASTGLGVWLEGRFQFCIPDVFQPVIDALLSGDEEFGPQQTALFGYGAFGQLMAWNPDYGLLQVDLPRLTATVTRIINHTQPDSAVLAVIAGIDDLDFGDWFEDDVEGAPLMLERVRKAVGSLRLGEVYGFVPALELGGRAHVKTTRRLQALEHFSVLAQSGPVSLFDYSEGKRSFVRNLGTH